MPAQGTFVGPHFSVESASAAGPTTITLVFSYPPIALDPDVWTDARNPANYEVTGQTAITVVSVVAADTDAKTFYLHLDAPMVQGEYTVKVVNVLAGSPPVPVGLPDEATFTAPRFEILPLSPGARNDSPEETIRKHLSVALQGPEWEAMIKALTVGDAYNQELAKSAFEQLFKATAGGIYLERLAADDGIAKPAIGISDENFRKLCIRADERVTEKAIWELLEVFYGANAVRSHTVSEGPDIFALQDGWTLELLMDESVRVSVPFTTPQFADIEQASILEVCMAITRAMEAVGYRGFALPYLTESGTNAVAIYSGTIGMTGSVRVVGGLAQTALRFPSYQVEEDDTNMSFSLDENGRLVGTKVLNVSDAMHQRGDYVVFLDGSYPLSGTHFIHSIEYDLLEDTTTITFETTGVQPGPMAYRIGYGRPSKSAPPVISVTSFDNEIQITLPPTPEVVNREPTKAAYLCETTAEEGVASGYLLDPSGGGALTSVETTITQNLDKGRSYDIVSVGDASDFPDEPGWLAFDLGYDTEVMPVRYLRRMSDTQLALDYGFKFPKSVQSGASVILLAQKGPWLPEDREALGAMYITGTPQGRIAATETVQESVAEGFGLRVSVKYPSDRGLGGAGSGYSGKRVSDIVTIYGNDDLELRGS